MKIIDCHGTGIGSSLSGPRWIVVRFVDGSWSTGGTLEHWRRDAPDCEAYVVYGSDCDSAKKKAQRYRTRNKSTIESMQP